MWTNVGTNLWTTASAIDGSVYAGNVIYNNGESCGLKCYSLSDLNGQGDWLSNHQLVRI